MGAVPGASRIEKRAPERFRRAAPAEGIDSPRAVGREGGDNDRQAPRTIEGAHDGRDGGRRAGAAARATRLVKTAKATCSDGQGVAAASTVSRKRNEG